MKHLFTLSAGVAQTGPRRVSWRLLLFLLALAGQRATAQENTPVGPYPNFFNTFDCFPKGLPSGQRAAAVGPGGGGNPAGRLSEYGLTLTPRGTLRVLVIYAGFTNDNVDPNTNPAGAAGISYNNIDPNNPWPQKLNGSAWGESLPRSAAANFYPDSTFFSPSARDQSLSNFYYQMSQFSGKPFKVMAVNFPVRVNVTATTAINDTYWAWDTYSQLVLRKIRTEPALQARLAALNRGWLDARTDLPNFRTDNSISAPDNKVDYTIIVWRYAGGRRGTGGPGTGGPMPTDSLFKAAGSGGAYASVPYDTLQRATITRPALLVDQGFTQCLGMSGIDHQLFTHEFAHTVYAAAHVNGNNGVCGQKYYVTTGNSMTTGSINAWERWFLGWAPLQCNGVSGDVTSAAVMPTTGRYLLRDFITTGDALRIRLPNTYNANTGTYQYLWLENHRKISIWDQLEWSRPASARRADRRNGLRRGHATEQEQPYQLDRF